MGRAKAIKELSQELGKRGVDNANAVATRMYDDGVQILDRSAVTLANQPSASARHLRRGGLYVGLGGVGAGGGLAARELLRKDQTRMRQATKREKVAMLEEILNDPKTDASTKQALIEALGQAGVFEQQEQQSVLDEWGLPTGEGGNLSLDPSRFFGGGIGGWIVFIIVAYFALKFYRAHTKNSSSGGAKAGPKVTSPEMKALDEELSDAQARKILEDMNGGGGGG
jgi:hypothetical protein